MEPVTISVILAGLAGAASTKVVDEVWTLGKKWLSDFFKDHGEAIKKNAQTNALVFLNDLAQRVQSIENSMKDSETASVFLEKKLSNPDFAASLQTALITSARTSSKYKKEILSRAVAEKLKTETEDAIDLSCSMAINLLQYLGENHLTSLGLITILIHVRPDKADLGKIKQENFPNWYTEWLIKYLSWVPVEFKISYFDYMHLMSLSCLNYMNIGSRDLKSTLEPEFELQKINSWSFDQFCKSELGNRISQWWNDGMNKVQLTSVGMLIGNFVIDNKLGTQIKFDLS